MKNNNGSMQVYVDKAHILVDALPFIREFHGITVVIKYGGSALGNEIIRDTLIKDIALMKYVGLKPVIVHGGGPEINDALDKAGIQSQFVDGLRVTSAEVMDIAQMVLAGKIGKQIASQITAAGAPAVGISGKDAHMLRVKRYAPNGKDIGFVGNITHVDANLVTTLIDNDFIPVISSVGVDDTGQTYNINADYVAVEIAGALKAGKLIFLTDVPGLLRDIDDNESVISHIDTATIKEYLNDGTVSGGMRPKMECCMAGAKAGVPHVHILDGRVEHALILEIFTKEGIGTMIVRSD